MKLDLFDARRCGSCGKKIDLKRDAATCIGITPDDPRPFAAVHQRCYTPPRKRPGGPHVRGD